jgi:hypothetical protein
MKQGSWKEKITKKISFNILVQIDQTFFPTKQHFEIYSPRSHLSKRYKPDYYSETHKCINCVTGNLIFNSIVCQNETTFQTECTDKKHIITMQQPSI